MTNQNQITLMTQFIESIGIPVVTGDIPDKTFLPGIFIDRGRLVVDWHRLAYPGDLLHEAGHIAVMSPDRRGLLQGDISKNFDDESAALCWSYAALRHLGLETSVVFHPDGYKGRAAGLAMSYDLGVYLGLQILRQRGLAADESQTDAAPFPNMVKWLR